MSVDSNPSAASLEDYQWLVDGPGRAWLRDRAELAPRALHERIRWLRRELTVAQAHCVLEQLELRARAARRFPAASRLYFRDRSLQQATDWTIASYKATRYPAQQTVFDLGCGIGGDLLPLAARGTTQGYDLDPVTVLLANANLRALDLSQGRAFVGDIGALQIAPEIAIHFDPDRRPAGRRSVQLDHHQPNPLQLAQWREHPAGLALKLAPATATDHPFLHDTELEWIGHHRECKQLVAWFGPLAQFPGQRRATRLDAAGQATSLLELPGASLTLTREVSQFVSEPIPCALAAGLAATIATAQQLRGLTAGGGYLTGDTPTQDGWTQVYQVLDVLPFRVKSIAARLRDLQIGRVEVKQRGVDGDPATLQRQLSRADGEPGTVIVTRQGKQQIAILARRLACAE